MTTVGEKIRTLRKQKRWTQEQLATRLDVAPTAVSAWERNANKPLMDKIVIMSEMFDVPISHFFDNVEEDKTILPVYGNIACGDGLVVYENTTEYEVAPKHWVTGGDYFYLRAEGDSMTGAGIKEGDLLLIRHQEQVENGEIAVVVIDEQVVLKRVYRQNGDFILISENPSYPPRTFNPEIDNNIRIIGRLKKAITDF